MQRFENHRVAFLCLASTWLAACSSMPPGSDLSDLAAQGSPIFGGTADPTDDAVQALLHIDQTSGQVSIGGCSGTTVATQGASGLYLTAAHCVVQFNAQGQIIMPVKLADPSTLWILPGADWATSYQQRQFFPVVDMKIHPLYDGNVSSPNDLALLRYVGATAMTSVVPALAPAEDMLAVGSTITVVGYGVTEANMQNTQRRKVDKQLARLSAQQIQYDQSDGKGPCEGDSGGPAFVQTAGGRRVGGVTSFGDATCTQLGVSVRVSSQYAFIQGFIDAAPKTLSCNDCTLGSVAPGNACFAQETACTTSNSACDRFYRCAAACTTPACVTACRTNNAAGATAYTGLVSCECGGSCATACATDPGCSGATTDPCGALSDPRPACATCMKQKCCAESAACGSDPTCPGCGTSQVGACGTNEPRRKLLACLATCAGDPCQTVVQVPDAGAPLPGGMDASSPDAGPPVGSMPDATPRSSADGGMPPDTTPPGNAANVNGSAGCSCRVDGSSANERAPLVMALAFALAIAARGRRIEGNGWGDFWQRLMPLERPVQRGKLKRAEKRRAIFPRA